MGIKELFGGGSKGVDCVQNEDGSQTCNIFKKDGNNLLATGTQFTLAVDPNSCDVGIVGHSRVSQDDEALVEATIKKMKQGCQRGIA